MVRRRGDGVRPLRNHPGAGHVLGNFGAGQMPADSGLRPLPHLDVNGRACIQIPLVYAEPAGGHPVSYTHLYTAPFHNMRGIGLTGQEKM